MMHKSDLERAIARYPRHPPALALMWFMSDRLRAGLGALTGRWEGNKNIRRSKDFYMEGPKDVVLYRLLKRRPRISTLEFSETNWRNINNAEMFAIRVDHPEINERRYVQFDRWYFDHSKDRAVVARQLIEARRQLREIPRVSPNSKTPAKREN